MGEHGEVSTCVVQPQKAGLLIQIGFFLHEDFTIPSPGQQRLVRKNLIIFLSLQPGRKSILSRAFIKKLRGSFLKWINVFLVPEGGQSHCDGLLRKSNKEPKYRR